MVFILEFKKMNMLLVVKLFVFLLLCGQVVGKECINDRLSSHTFRYELLKSNNESLKEEIFSHYHLTPTDEMAWTSLFPRKMLREEDDEYAWMMMYRKMKTPTSGFGSNSGNFLKEVSLHDVRLDQDSVYGRAQQTNLEYLLMLDVDNLVWSFRKTAGLDTPGKPYGGWEELELRGHFVGHYLSASAQMWASTHNQTLKTKMSAVVSALSACQKAMGNGYLSAFPTEFFDRFEALRFVWAPYYTIHKIMAGLLDQYKFVDDDEALEMAIRMANYFYDRVQNVIKTYTVERHWQSLNEETGGMNDVLYQLFNYTRDSKHLVLAHLFDKPCFLGLLAVQADDISEFHANTHIPIVVGSQLRYEITGDPLYKEISSFFMDIVNSSHTYATGGTSVHEFWSDPKRLANHLENQTETEESCTTYNMLKVSRNLFRWTKEAAYGDYYERALTNGVLGIQRGTEPGKMIYMLPLGHGVSKAASHFGWGTPFDSFWCCYGTGIESFSKLGDSIYFEEDGETPGLYVIQYIPSSLDWKSGNLQLNQKVERVASWDPALRVTFTFSSKQETSKMSTLNLRIPVWTNSEAAKAAINGQDFKVPAPGNFLSITRSWKAGDKVTLELPLILMTEAIKDDRPEYSSLQAILYGPYLLAGHTTQSWSRKLQSSNDSPANWIKPIPESQNNYLVTFLQESGNSTLVLANSNQSVTLQEPSLPGTDSAVHSTFRLISADESFLKEINCYQDLIGKPVLLEPFDLPGFLVSQETDSNNLVVEKADSSSCRFVLVPGLNKKPGSVSLELESRKGCYVSGGINPGSGRVLKTECKSETAADESFKEGVSFVMKRGHSQYHPISFVAKGKDRDFVMAPLFSFRDETYNVYFYI